jgi:hypothetical protein
MKGNVSIVRRTSNSGEGILIEITDEKSNVRFLQVTMDLVDFAKVITGVGYIPCDFELMGVDKVGMVFEHKKVNIPVSTHKHFTEEELDELVGPLEVGGWVARRDSVNNHHNWVTQKDKKYVSVSFGRWVEDTE